MKTLYITSKPPYPKIDGGCVASANFLDCLLSFSEVKHFTISTKKHPFLKEQFPENLRNQIETESIEVNTGVSIYKAFTHLFNTKSYNITRFDSSIVHEKIIEILKSEFDNIILDSLYSTAYIETIRSHSNAKIFIRTHNVEYKIWESLAINSSNTLKRKYFKLLAKDLKKYEIVTLNKADGILSLSNEDSLEFSNAGINTKTKLISVTVDRILQVSDYNSNSIFHLGAMNWEPNIEAVSKLLQIFPELRKVNPTISLHIAGSNMKECTLDFNQENIVNDGFVRNLEKFVSENGILVTPIYSGSGVRIKILEMMALGVPIITTSLGAQGISVNNNLLIAESNQDFIKKITDLFSDKLKREQLGMNAIAYIRKNHSKTVVSKELSDFINEA